MKEEINQKFKETLNARIERGQKKRKLIRRIILFILLLLLVAVVSVWCKIVKDANVEQIPVIEKNVFKQVNINNINADIENRKIEKILPISNNEYLIIDKDFLSDEQIENVETVNLYNYNIYKYNIDTKIVSNSINIDTAFRIVGINSEERCIYLAVTDLIIQEGSVESPYRIMKINYDTMEKEYLSDSTNGSYNFVISDDGQTWIYLKGYDMYVSGYNFDNERLLLKANSEEPNIEPCDIIGDNIIYISYNEFKPEENGFGIINIISEENNKFINILDAIYLGYNTYNNSILFTQTDILNKVLQVNLDTLEITEFFSWEVSDEIYSNLVFISSDYKYIVSLEDGMIDNEEYKQIKLLDVMGKRIITEHIVDNMQDISQVLINNEQVKYIQDGNVYNLYIE